MIRESIIKLSKKQNLTYLEAEEVMDEIMSGKATPVQMSAYLTALALKGETIDEITASAAGMRAHCIKLLNDMDVLEIVGTVHAKYDNGVLTVTFPKEAKKKVPEEKKFISIEG